jgi:hypothetical protein
VQANLKGHRVMLILNVMWDLGALLLKNGPMDQNARNLELKGILVNLTSNAISPPIAGLQLHQQLSRTKNNVLKNIPNQMALYLASPNKQT